MKKKFILNVFSFLAFFLFSVNNLSAQWVQCNGPFGGIIYATAFSGNNILAGIPDSGVYISTNNGVNWIHSDLNNKTVRSLIISGSSIFAGTWNSGVYLSTNYGINWAQTSLNNQTANYLAESGNYLYAGTNNGVFVSANSGLNWVQTPLNQPISSIAVSENSVFAGISTYPNPGIIYFSSNNGTNWSQTSFNFQSVLSLAIIGNNIFAGASGGLYKSTNNGLNWSLIYLNNQNVNSLFSDGNILFAGTGFYDGKIYRTTDNGVNWTQTRLNSGSVFSFAVSGNNILAGTYNGGLFLSVNSGINWEQIGILKTPRIKSLTSNGSSIFAGTENNGAYISTNNGASWTHTSIYYRSVYSFAVNGNYIYAGADSGLYHSTNNGVNWTLNHFSWGGPVYSAAVNGNYVFATEENLDWFSLYRSTNSGESWIDTTGFSGNNPVLLSYGNNIFLGTSSAGGYVYITSNYGVNWTGSSLYPNGLVISLAASGNNIYAGTRKYSIASGDFGLCISTNNGISWTLTSLNNRTIKAIAATGDNVIAGTQDSGLYLSTNNGQNWIKINQGFGTTPTVNTLLIANNYIYAGTDSYSLWRRPLSELINGINPNNTEVPSTFSLSQNYPNPFNPTTTISYKVKSYKVIKLSVFNILGKVLSTLVNEKQSPGTYEVTWDGSSYPSGVYFYSLYTDGQRIETKKMLLIK
ncbi:MAG: T9SS type A sorting domain-containing protein [Ignavibacteriae bacterium]|nr:T9SS type A sorting domain-containing protein [Ignavibacteriota bacterium]